MEMYFLQYMLYLCGDSVEKYLKKHKFVNLKYLTGPNKTLKKHNYSNINMQFLHTKKTYPTMEL